jgi:hypothetical protein
MATWTITFYPYNILELGSFGATDFGDTPLTPDTGYPESRLYDRVISLFWKYTGTTGAYFVVDQSAITALAVNFLAISKHNFGSDKYMQWQYSDDGNTWYDYITDWTQTDNNQIIKTEVTPLTKDYWRVALTTIANPQCSEIFMSRAYSFNALREEHPAGRHVSNVKWARTIGGESRSTKFGEKKRVRDYTIWMSSSEWADFETVLSYLNDYSYPFYFKDHEGDYYMAHFEEEPEFDFNHNEYTMVKCKIIEI